MTAGRAHWRLTAVPSGKALLFRRLSNSLTLLDSVHGQALSLELPKHARVEHVVPVTEHSFLVVTDSE